MSTLQPASSSPRRAFFLPPRTRPGKLAVMLASAVAGFVLIFFMFAATQSGGEEFFDNLWLAIPVTLAGASGVGAAIAGIWALIARHERSMYVFVATLVGLVVILVAFEEIVLGH